MPTWELLVRNEHDMAEDQQVVLGCMAKDVADGGIAFYVNDITTSGFDGYAAELYQDASNLYLYLNEWDGDSTPTHLATVDLEAATLVSPWDRTADYNQFWIAVDLQYFKADGRILVYCSPVEAEVLQARHLLIDYTDATPLTAAGKVGIVTGVSAQMRFADIRVGSPQRAVFAETAGALRGPIVLTKDRRIHVTAGWGDATYPDYPQAGDLHFKEHEGHYAWYDGQQWLVLGEGGGLQVLFMDTNTSDVSGYRDLYTDHGDIGGTINSVSLSSLLDGENLVEEWVTTPGSPGAHFITDGFYHWHIHAYNSYGAGSKDIQVFARVYKRTDPGGTETLIGETKMSEVIDIVNTYETDLEFYSSEVDIDTTDRIVLKAYAYVTGTGAAPTVTFRMEGTTYSRLELPIQVGSGGGDGDDTLAWLGGIF